MTAKLDLSLQQFDAEIIVYKTKKAYKKACKQLGVDPTITMDGVTTVLTKGTELRIWVYTPYNLGLIVHELSHVVTELMNYYGISCDEFRAYTLQYMVEETNYFLEAK